jgi:hypothetical protein
VTEERLLERLLGRPWEGRTEPLLRQLSRQLEIRLCQPQSELVNLNLRICRPRPRGSPGPSWGGFGRLVAAELHIVSGRLSHAALHLFNLT